MYPVLINIINVFIRLGVNITHHHQWLSLNDVFAIIFWYGLLLYIDIKITTKKNNLEFFGRFCLKKYGSVMVVNKTNVNLIPAHLRTSLIIPRENMIFAEKYTGYSNCVEVYWLVVFESG